MSQNQVFQQFLTLAETKAAKLGHEYVSTGQILLGLARESSSVASKVLKGIDISKIWTELVKLTGSNPDQIQASDFPLTPRAKQVVDRAGDEAKVRNQNYVSTEHLLLSSYERS